MLLINGMIATKEDFREFIEWLQETYNKQKDNNNKNNKKK